MAAWALVRTRRPTVTPSVVPAGPPVEAAAPSPPPAAEPASPAPTPAPAAGEDRLAESVAAVYRTARRSFARTGELADRAALEELLDHTTALWRAASVAEAFSPEAAKRLARDSRRLADLLREHRDLAELAAGVEAGAAFGDAARARIGRLTGRRLRRLERRARKRGNALYAAKPSRVAWRVAEDGARGDG